MYRDVGWDYGLGGGVESRSCGRWLPLSGNEVGSFFFFFEDY